jgi:hypothetical protein
MTSQHVTFEAAVVVAGTTKNQALVAADSAYVSSVTTAASANGWRPGQATGEAAYFAALAAAAKARDAARLAAEQARQLAVQQARDTLRSAGALNEGV